MKPYLLDIYRNLNNKETQIQLEYMRFALVNHQRKINNNQIIFF
jgi:hypothetical protein